MAEVYRDSVVLVLFLVFFKLRIVNRLKLEEFAAGGALYAAGFKNALVKDDFITAGGAENFVKKTFEFILVIILIIFALIFILVIVEIVAAAAALTITVAIVKILN